MDNQILAKVIFTNKLATKEQIQKHWPQCSPERDISKVLLEAGVLSQSVYDKLIEFVKNVAPPKAELAIQPVAPPVVREEVKESQNSLTLESNAPYGRSEVDPATIASLPQREDNHIAQFAPDSKVEVLSVIDLGRGPGLPGAAAQSAPPMAAPAAAMAAATPAPVPLGENKLALEAPLPRESIRLVREGKVTASQDMPSVNDDLQTHLLWARAQGAVNICFRLNAPLLLHGPGGSSQFPQLTPDQERLNAHLQNVFAGIPPRHRCSRLLDLGAVGMFRLQSDATGKWISAHLLSPPPTLEDLSLPDFCAKWPTISSGLLLFCGTQDSDHGNCLAAFAANWLANNARRALYLGAPAAMEIPEGQGMLWRQSVGFNGENLTKMLEGALVQEPALVVVDAPLTARDFLLIMELANAGSLVIASMPGQSVLTVLLKIPEMFPANRQVMVRNLIADTLRGILCRRLLPHASQTTKRVPLHEGIWVTPAISSLIRRNDLYQLPAAMTSLKTHGITLEDSLEQAVQSGLISGSQAWVHSADSRRFANYRPEQKKRS